MPIFSSITQIASDWELQQFSGQIYRRLEASSATSWTKIRIGIRFSVTQTYNSTHIFGLPRLFLGVCNFDKGGPTTMSQAAHALGVRNTTTQVTNNGLTSFSFGMVASHRVNGVYTESGSLGGTYRISSGTILCMTAVQIDKSTPGSTTVSLFRPNNSVSGIFNVTHESFLEQMENNTPSLSGYAWNDSGTTFNVDEATNGYLDSVCLSWDRTSIPLWVGDICWSQLA